MNHRRYFEKSLSLEHSDALFDQAAEINDGVGSWASSSRNDAARFADDLLLMGEIEEGSAKDYYQT